MAMQNAALGGYAPLQARSLSQSYTSGYSSTLSTNNSPRLPTNIDSFSGVSPLTHMQERINSPMRFCAQAKDRFVVRIVKVIDKSSALKHESKSNPPRSNFHPTTQDIAAFQALLQQPASQGSNIFIGFQAQLPASVGEYVSRSTSADQVNNHDYQLYRRRKVGKGVRLCFSCPLRGNGLKIEDFYSGLVSQRLEVWEARSGIPGILNEVLNALQKSVELLLTIIKQDAFQTVLPEIDYIFYPFTPGQLCPIPWHSRAPSYSSDTADCKLRVFDSRPDPGSPICICVGTVSPTQSYGQSSPVVIPSIQKTSTNNSCTLPNPHRRQNISNEFSNERPASAYGKIFGNGDRINYLVPQQHLSVSSVNSANNANDNLSIVTHNFQVQRFKNNVFFAYDEEGITSPNFDPRFYNSFSPSLQPSTDGSPRNYSHIVLCDVHHENGTETYGTGQPCRINTFPTSGRESERLQVEVTQQGPGIQSALLTKSMNSSLAVLPSQEKDPLASLINEVVERLRKSPHLPLIIMPTQNNTPTNSLAGTPLVFQLSSPDVVFVGLPANGSERPRIVTSPADSAFVVTSRRPVNIDSIAAPGGNSTSKYTVATPRPGFMLAVSADGRTCEFNETIKR